MSTTEKTFEEAVKRLEEIVGRLDGGGIALEELMKLYEEGTGLVNSCNDFLDSAEQKITQLESQ